MYKNIYFFVQFLSFLLPSYVFATYINIFENFNQILIDFLLNFYVINIKIGLHNDCNLIYDIVTENVLK